MSLSRLIASALMCAAVATPVSADVTLRLKGTGSILGTEAQESTEYRKGLKLRVDSTSNGVTASSIFDLGSGWMIMLWHHSKTADLIERKQISELLAKDGLPVARPSITATGRSRQIAASTCIVHEFRASYSTEKLDMVPPIMVMQGTMCLVRNGPGQADFMTFYQAAGGGVFLPDPSLGVPFATEITIGFKGDGPMAETIEMGTYTTEVSSVSTAPIADAMFEIPADYRVTKR